MKFFTDRSLQNKVLELIKSTVDVITVEQFIAVPVIQKVFKDTELGYVVTGSCNKDDFVFTVKQIKYDTDEAITLGNVHIGKSDIDGLRKLGFKKTSSVKISYLPSGIPLRFVDYSVVASYKDRTVTTKFDTFNEALNHAQNKMNHDVNIIKCYIEENVVKEVCVLKRT